MREQIKIAAKMYDCQETAMKFFKEEYPAKVKWYVDTLKAVMSKENIGELEAVLFVSKLDSVKDNGMAVMMFMAAAVEIIEGKPKKGGQHTNDVSQTRKYKTA